jgi:hypothetical protein
MDVRSTFEIGLYVLGAASLLGSASVVSAAILLFERRRKTDLRTLSEAFSRILMEFSEPSGSDPARPRPRSRRSPPQAS